ncbi:MAG: porin [Janthinobacterium lividum]
MATGVVGAAHAQSSVTLYGTIDAGITYVSNENGHPNVKTDNGILHGNRFGLRGTEDLGGGYATIFDLEGGYNLSTGKSNQGGALFGRQSWVGLKGPYGTVQIGNQYDLIADTSCNFNVSFYASGYGIHQGDFDRMSCTRESNAVKYTTPTFHGLTAGAMYSFSNTAGQFHDGSSWSAGGMYNQGPISAAIAYSFQSKPSIDPYNRIGTRVFFGQTVARVTNGSATDLATAVTMNSIAALDLGASYTMGNLVVMGDFTDTTLKYLGASSVMHVYEIGALYNLTSKLKLGGGYQHTGFQSHTWNEGSAGLLYSLSKRTQVYVSGDYVEASAGVDPVIGWGFTPSLSNKQADVRVGLYTKF